MHDYEIRLFKAEDNHPCIHLTSQASDYSAVRRAKRLAADSDAGFEVWRGLNCVYAETGRAPLNGWPTRSRPDSSVTA
jgi:hypothetical protein